jgi:hypothetical protein
MSKRKCISKIKCDKRNYRKHSDRNRSLINKSLQECGAGRSIIIDAEDNIIGGNGVYEAAEKLKIPVKIIETDGKELIAVKRKDLKPNDPKRKQLAIMDNSTSDTSEFDFELLTEDFSFSEIADFGVDMDYDENTAEQLEDAEIDHAELTKNLNCKCPKCGFEFEAKKQ